MCLFMKQYVEQFIQVEISGFDCIMGDSRL